MKHEEDDLQMEVVKHLVSNGVFCLHVPNERNTGVVEMQRLSKMGVKKGAPDLIVYNNGWEWWELKAKKGKQSLEQKCFMDISQHLGVKYVIIKSKEDMMERLKEGTCQRTDCQG